MNTFFVNASRRLATAMCVFCMAFLAYSCGENLDVPPSTEPTTKPADSAIVTTLHIGDVAAGGVSITPASRATFDYPDGNTALPSLSEKSDFTTLAIFYNKTRNLKGRANLTWVVSRDADGNIQLVNQSPTINVTAIGTTPFTVAQGDECYMNAIMGSIGGTPNINSTTGQVTLQVSNAFNPATDGKQVSVPYYTGWQPLTVNSSNAVKGKVKFAAQGSLVVARIKRDTTVSRNYEYQLFSTSLAPSCVFDMTATTTLGAEATPTAPTITIPSGGNTTDDFNGNLYYTQDSRNITTEAGYDKVIFWGMPTTPNKGNHITKILPKYGGYWLVRDNNNNETAQAVFTSQLNTNGGLLRFTLKAKKASHPDYNFLNPLGRVALHNIGKTPGTFASDDTFDTSVMQNMSNITSPSLTPKWMPEGYKVPTIYEFHAAFPVLFTTQNSGPSYTYSGGWKGFSILSTSPGPYSVKEELSLGNGGSSSTNWYQWASPTTIYALRWEYNSKVGQMLRCAYRYEFLEWNTNNARLRVTSRYLGEHYRHINQSRTLNTAAFWAADIPADEVRVFPVMGYARSIGGAVTERGVRAYYWTRDNVVSGNVNKNTSVRFRYWGTNNPAFEYDDDFRGDNYYPVRPVSELPIYKNG